MPKLTVLKVKNAKPGRHGDGGGLYLLVSKGGARSWMLRTVVDGKRRDLGLGSADLVTLEEARDKARELRKVARAGGNPVAHRDKRDETPPTFRESARACHDAKRAGWSEKNATSFLSSLEQHVFPVIGDSRVDLVSDRDVAATLSPLWTSKAAMAKKLRARIGLVLNYAKAEGWRVSGAPREALSTLLPKQPSEGNFAAMPYEDVPAFFAVHAGKDDTPSRLALLTQILTGARHGEVRSALWSHFDLDKAL